MGVSGSIDLSQVDFYVGELARQLDFDIFQYLRSQKPPRPPLQIDQRPKTDNDKLAQEFAEQLSAPMTYQIPESQNKPGFDLESLELTNSIHEVPPPPQPVAEAPQSPAQASSNQQISEPAFNTIAEESQEQSYINTYDIIKSDLLWSTQLLDSIRQIARYPDWVEEFSQYNSEMLEITWNFHQASEQILVATVPTSKYADIPVCAFTFSIDQRLKKAQLLNALLKHRALWDPNVVDFNVEDQEDDSKICNYTVSTEKGIVQFSDILYVKMQDAVIQIVYKSIDQEQEKTDDMLRGRNVFSVLTVQNKVYESTIFSVSQVSYGGAGDDADIAIGIAEKMSAAFKQALSSDRQQ